MGFTELLTIIFIVLKLMGFISWNWFLVLLPEIIAVVMYIIWFIVAVLIIKRATKKFIKSFKSDFWD